LKHGDFAPDDTITVGSSAPHPSGAQEEPELAVLEDAVILAQADLADFGVGILAG
jgi:hypothetical protein